MPQSDERGRLGLADPRTAVPPDFESRRGFHTKRRAGLHMAGGIREIGTERRRCVKCFNLFIASALEANPDEPFNKIGIWERSNSAPVTDLQAAHG